MKSHHSRTISASIIILVRCTATIWSHSLCIAGRIFAVEAPADQTELNALYTKEATEFIQRQSGNDKPFFLYFAHNFPHIPLFVADDAKGRSDAGLYGDVVESLDRGVAAIVESLEQQDMLENTIIILTSDNGPWYEGSPGFNRGRKGQTWEGGMHVPFLVHWPAEFAGGRQIDGMSMGIDLLPTLAHILNIPLPEDRIHRREEHSQYAGDRRRNTARSNSTILQIEN